MKTSYWYLVSVQSINKFNFYVYEQEPNLNITFIYKSALSNIYYCVNIARSNPDRIGLFVWKLSPHKIMSPSQIPTLLDCPNPNPNHSHALPRPRSQMHCNLIGLVNWPDSRTIGLSDTRTRIRLMLAFRRADYECLYFYWANMVREYIDSPQFKYMWEWTVWGCGWKGPEGAWGVILHI